RAWLQEIAANAGLDFETLCTLLIEKRLPELDEYIVAADINSATAKKLSQLPRLMGDAGLLPRMRKVFAQDAMLLKAIEDMELLAKRIGSQYPDVDLLFNLSEIQGSDYHTGLLFWAYSDLDGRAVRVANGGRYDEVGQAFGRSRPATGFSADLKVLAQLMDADISGNDVIYAPVPEGTGNSTEGFWQKVAELREQGLRVRLGYPSESKNLSEHLLSRKLVASNGDWILVDFD
ncbi:MAG: ATP phosphoribosyltransferase regulatory subunit, partial [Pseudomonadales bacterium]